MELSSQVKDANSQQKEYKQMLKRMSSTVHDQSSFSNFKYQAEQISPNRSRTFKFKKNETVDGLSSLVESDSQEVNMMAKENESLKKRLELLQDMVASDKA